MWCKIYFIISDSDNDSALSLLNNNYDFELITNSSSLIKSAKSKNISAHLFENIQPDIGENAEKIVSQTNSLLENYRKMFKLLTFDGKEIFGGFDYSLFRQLLFMIKIKNILNNKKNFVFIFEGVTISRISVIKIASNLGYNVDKKIGIIKDGKTNWFSNDEEKILGFIKKQSLKNTSKLMSESNNKNFLTNNFSKQFKIISKIMPLVKKWIFFKVNLLFKNEPTDIIKKLLSKKLINYSNLDVGFFLTTGRIDLYLMPWKSCLSKLKQMGKTYKIFTSDLATETILGREKIPCIGLFEEVNIISREIANTEIGKSVLKKFESILHENKNLFGIELIRTDLKNKIIRSLAILIIIKYLLEILKFNTIIACADGEMLENISVLIAKEKHIPSYSMVPTYLDYQPMFANWFHSDKIFCYGLDDYETLKKLGYENRLIIVGNPKFDHVKAMSGIEKRELLFTKYKINKDKKLIAILMSEWHENDEVWMSKLIDFSNKNGYEIVIKTHPKYVTSSQELHKSKIENINKKCKNLRYLISNKIDTNILIASADLVMTDYSAIGLDAIIMDKMLVNVDFNFKEREKFNITRQFSESKFSLFVNNYDKLEELILGFFTEKLNTNKIKNERNKIIKKYDYYNDGKVADRICKHIFQV